MKEFQLILEDYLTESATIQMYHGGNLELTPRGTLHPDMFDKVPASKRQEYGPGLYLTTSEKVVEKYAKGSRKLYKITLKRGRDISDVKLPISAIDELTESMGKAKVKKIKERIEGSRFEENGKVGAYIILNFCINDKLLQTERGRRGMRDFLVKHGIDYELHQSPFGWKESMIVLFNLKLIQKVEQLNKKDVIDSLPNVQ